MNITIKSEVTGKTYTGTDFNELKSQCDEDDKLFTESEAKKKAEEEEKAKEISKRKKEIDDEIKMCESECNKASEDYCKVRNDFHDEIKDIEKKFSDSCKDLREEFNNRYKELYQTFLDDKKKAGEKVIESKKEYLKCINKKSEAIKKFNSEFNKPYSVIKTYTGKEAVDKFNEIKSELDSEFSPLFDLFRLF